MTEKTKKVTALITSDVTNDGQSPSQKLIKVYSKNTQ